MIDLRLGLPKTTGRLGLAAERLRVPVLISAASLWDHEKRQFRHPGTVIGELDAALDSAGFTAMRKWKGYPWPMLDYVDIAFGYGWDWWSQPDLCCEPQIARSPAVVRERVLGSVRLLAECRSVAIDLRSRVMMDLRHTFYTPGQWADFGERACLAEYSMPMPVLQGWRPGDYALSIEAVDRVLDGVWPDLVGVGSVCRRPVHGPAGLITILAHLDQLLPASVRLHLFGVKGSLIPHLAPFRHRVASLDSMAWDYAAMGEIWERRRQQEAALRAAGELGAEERIDKKDPRWIPCDTATKIRHLRRWVRQQRRALRHLDALPPAPLPTLPLLGEQAPLFLETSA